MNELPSNPHITKQLNDLHKLITYHHIDIQLIYLTYLCTDFLGNDQYCRVLPSISQYIAILQCTVTVPQIVSLLVSLIYDHSELHK